MAKFPTRHTKSICLLWYAVALPLRQNVVITTLGVRLVCYKTNWIIVFVLFTVALNIQYLKKKMANYITSYQRPLYDMGHCVYDEKWRTTVWWHHSHSVTHLHNAIHNISVQLPDCQMLAFGMVSASVCLSDVSQLHHIKTRRHTVNETTLYSLVYLVTEFDVYQTLLSLLVLLTFL